MPELATTVSHEPVAGIAAVSDLEEGELSDSDSAKKSTYPPPSRTLLPRSSGRSDEYKPGERDDGREIARKALRELEENKIGFLSVAAEVVDEELTAASLQKLYSEIGILISSAELAAASVFDTKRKQKQAGNKTGSREFNTDLGKLRGSSPSSVFKHASHSISATSDGALDSPVQDNAVTESATHVIPIHPTKAVTASAAASKNQVSTPTNSLGKPPIAKTNDKAFDRKDYIARMLAAKAGKTLPAVDGTSFTSPSPKLATSTVPKLSLTKETRTTSKAGQEMSQDKGPQKAQGEAGLPGQAQTAAQDPNSMASNIGLESRENHTAENALVKTVDQADAQAKKKAQTELARQKMEALRNRENLQRKDQTERGSTVTVVEPLPLPGIPPTPVMPSNKPAGPAPMMAQIAPSPQHSVFSLVSAKPLFNLPGLFMSHELSASVPTVPQPSQYSTPSGSQAPSTAQPVAATTVSETLPSASSPAPPKPTKSVEPSSRDSSSIEAINSTRKRQKASDFIEPPSTRIKRHLGPSEDKGVVIEVSEDDAFDGFAEDDVDMDVDTDQDIYGNTSLKPGSTPCSQQKGPLKMERRGSELTRQNQVSAIATPPLPSTPAKVCELNGLRSKEKEIELMNKKIAELEQRRKAKQSSSRAQTPSVIGTRSSSPKAGTSVLDATGQPQTALVTEEPLAAVEQQMSQEVLDVAAAEANEAGKKARLLIEDQAGQIEGQRAKDTEAVQLRETEAHPLRELENLRNEELERQRVEIEQQQARDLEERQARQLEEQRVSDLEDQRMTDLEQQKAEGSEVGRLTVQRQRAVESGRETQRQRKLERRAAIEAGLPVLDAEVDKTKQKLQLLRRQIKELETELERGIEGRRGLVEELEALGTLSDMSPGQTKDAMPENSRRRSPMSSADSSGKCTSHYAAFQRPQTP